MKLGTPRSPKFRRLMKASGLGTRELAGTLELMWLFAMEHAPAGDIGKWSDDEIEEACEWDGEPGLLVASLVGSGWLDACPCHRLTVHDWSDHVPEFIKLRVKRGSLTLIGGCSTSRRPDTDQSPMGHSPTPVDREVMGSNGKGSTLTPEDRRPDTVRSERAGGSESRPLLNLIASLEGELDEKTAWLEAEWPVIEAEAEADPNPKRVKAIAIRFYRNYLAGPRKFRGWTERQETLRRMTEHEAEFAADMARLEAEEGHATAHR